MSDIKYAFLMIYNAVVVVASAMSVYYISGWMIFLILAVMRAEIMPNDSVTMKTILPTTKTVYWPIGGRVHKLETSLDAAKRKIKEEIGIDFTAELAPIGFYEDVYEKNSFGDGPYHTLSTVWLGHLSKKEFKNIKLDSTASEYKLDKHMPERFKVQTFADYGRPYWYLDSIGKSENKA